MFLRATKRKKDGKEHLYWSLVENVRVGRRVFRIARGEAEPPQAVASPNLDHPFTSENLNASVLTPLRGSPTEYTETTQVNMDVSPIKKENDPSA